VGKTVLNLVKGACYSTGFTSVPTTLVSPTDFSVLQLLELFYDVGRDLRSARCWPQLQKTHSVILEPGRKFYPLPEDFYAYSGMTGWDHSTSWPLQGPLTATEYSYRLLGYVTVENRKAFRVFGPDVNPNTLGGQISIDPAPGDSLAGVRISFEYQSRNWLTPPLWTPGTSFGANTYCFSSGNIYQKGSGSANCGSVAPTVNRGEGVDGGMRWTVLNEAAWQSSTAYAGGRYVTNGGNLYFCTSGGISASSGGPSGTDADTDETDGTATWRYLPTSAWAAQTEYEVGDVVTQSGRYYRASNTRGTQFLKSGQTAPTWDTSNGTTWTESDGTITWTQRTAAYEEIVLDTDLCLFDDEIMQWGLRARFLESKSLTAQAAIAAGHYERLKTTAMARWNGAKKISLANGGYVPGLVYPNIPEGSFTF